MLLVQRAGDREEGLVDAGPVSLGLGVDADEQGRTQQSGCLVQVGQEMGRYLTGVLGGGLVSAGGAGQAGIQCSAPWPTRRTRWTWRVPLPMVTS
ncbi:hypothetical protein SFUMM280S_01379 [Streptomyces fumanus]